MRRIAIAAVVLAVGAAPAAAAQKPWLTVKEVGKPPASIQVGAAFKLAVRIVNAKGRPATGGRVTVTLRTAKTKRKLAGHTLETRVKPGWTRDVTFTLGIATTTPPGKYDLVACVRATGNTDGDCRTARTVTIVGD